MIRLQRRRALERGAVSSGSVLTHRGPVRTWGVAVELKGNRKKGQRFFGNTLARGCRRNLDGRNFPSAHRAVARRLFRRGNACRFVSRRHRSRALEDHIVPTARLGAPPGPEYAHQADHPRQAANGQMEIHQWDARDHKDCPEVPAYLRLVAGMGSAASCPHAHHLKARDREWSRKKGR
jgi:hypothetical protein